MKVEFNGKKKIDFKVGDFIYNENNGCSYLIVANEKQKKEVTDYYLINLETGLIATYPYSSLEAIQMTYGHHPHHHHILKEDAKLVLNPKTD